MENSHMDRRTKYSVHALQMALLELLEKKNLDSISVTELCAQADVNRGTFYKYYRDVYELYDQIEDGFVDKLRELLEESVETDSDQMSLFARVTTMLQGSRAFLRPRYKDEGTVRLLNKLLALVLPGMTAHVIRHRPNLEQTEARFLGEYIIGGCARMYEIWIQEGMSVPADDLQRYITSFVESSLQIQ